MTDASQGKARRARFVDRRVDRRQRRSGCRRRVTIAALLLVLLGGSALGALWWAHGRLRARAVEVITGIARRQGAAARLTVTDVGLGWPRSTLTRLDLSHLAFDLHMNGVELWFSELPTTWGQTPRPDWVWVDEIRLVASAPPTIGSNRDAGAGRAEARDAQPPVFAASASVELGALRWQGRATLARVESDGVLAASVGKLETPWGVMGGRATFAGGRLAFVPDADGMALTLPGLPLVHVAFERVEVDTHAWTARIVAPRVRMGEALCSMDAVTVSRDQDGAVALQAGPGVIEGLPFLKGVGFLGCSARLDRHGRLRRVHVQRPVAALDGLGLAGLMPRGAPPGAAASDESSEAPPPGDEPAGASPPGEEPARDEVAVAGAPLVVVAPRLLNGRAAAGLLSLIEGVTIGVENGRLVLGDEGDEALNELNMDWHDGGLHLSAVVTSGEVTEGTMTVRWTEDGASRRLRASYTGCLLVHRWRSALQASGFMMEPGCRDVVSIEARLDGQVLRFHGRAQIDSWRIEASGLSDEPLSGLGFEADIAGELGLDLEHLRLRLDPLSFGPLDMAVALQLQRAPEVGPYPVVDLDLSFPEQACDNLVRAIPEAMRPGLKGLWLGGRFSLGFHYSSDFNRVFAMYDARAQGQERWYESTLEVEGEDECRVVSHPKEIDVTELLSPFYVCRFHREDGDEILAGPGSMLFTPIEDMPAAVKMGALATEDWLFYEHPGINPNLVRTAFEMDVHAGRFKYGGSTITQQLVKNLYFSRTKTLARKVQELFVSLLLETVVSKDRILELYLNCIEFGRELHGVEAAARTYFGVRARDLRPEQAAFLMTCKPSPRDCQRLYDRRRGLSPLWRSKVDYVLDRLNRRFHVLNDSEVEDARAREITFHYGPPLPAPVREFVEPVWSVPAGEGAEPR